MPTYEYACRDCGEQLEVVQSFHDDALTECPHCHGNLRKVFSAVGIAFKGDGFYKTDSRLPHREGKAGESKSESTSTSDSKDTAKTEKKADKKADAKAEKKSETKSPAKSGAGSTSSSSSTS